MRARRSMALIGLVLLLGLLAALAQPTPPTDVSVVTSSRRAEASSATVPAYAGNVTELRINVSMVTQGWQAFYGTVSGTIVLDDAFNNSVYTWDLTSPEGEIYATRNNTPLNWTAGNIVCANLTNVETEESALNFNLGGGQDADGINETFTNISHPSFSVGLQSFAADQCNFTVSTYVNDSTPGGSVPRSFNETLLYSASERAVVYTALVTDDNYGFNGSRWDFQMLVGEDGHSGDTASTPYYFYVELS